MTQVRDLNILLPDTKGVVRNHTLSVLSTGGVWCFHPSVSAKHMWEVRHIPSRDRIHQYNLVQEDAERLSTVLSQSIPDFTYPELVDDELLPEEVYEDTVLKVTLHRAAEFIKLEKNLARLEPTNHLRLMLVLMDQIRFAKHTNIDKYVRNTQDILEYIGKHKDGSMTAKDLSRVDDALSGIIVFRESVRALYLQSGVYPND